MYAAEGKEMGRLTMVDIPLKIIHHSPFSKILVADAVASI